MRSMVTVFAVGVVCATPAWAQSAEHYRCTIKEVWAQNMRDGTLHPLEGLAGIMVGEEFMVDRDTGRILHDALMNCSIFDEPEVLDPGSDEQSFKVITIYRPSVTIDLLTVSEYAAGDEKPFRYWDSNTLYTGICTHS